jgi:hypothetical protein
MGRRRIARTGELISDTLNQNGRFNQTMTTLIDMVWVSSLVIYEEAYMVARQYIS